MNQTRHLFSFVILTAFIVLLGGSTAVAAVSQSQCQFGCSPGYFYSNCTASCVKCSPGFVCHGNMSIPTPCPSGTFSTKTGAATNASCTRCSLGYYSAVPGSTTCTPCTKGSYASRLGSTRCTLCPKGSASGDAASSCAPCPRGKFASNTTGQCEACTTGFACPSRTIDKELKCALGTYSQPGDGYCRKCEPGFACPSTATQCFTGSLNKYACPLGTYSTGNQTSCTPCPAMYYCSDPRRARPVKCPTGWYSLAGASNCTLCPEGYMCPSNSKTGHPILCGSGTSSISHTNCTICPAGFYCPSPAKTLPCPVGMYSRGGLIKACSNCPSGFYCPDASKPPLPCPRGTFSPGGLVKACLPCNTTCDRMSYYQNATAQTECKLCPAGFSCPRPTDTPLPCPKGYFSRYGQKACTHCSLSYNYATYTPYRASEFCSPCPIGFKCPDPSRTPIPCEKGTYSREGQSKVNCTICPAGFKCETPSSIPIPCVFGTYSLAGSTTCNICPLNHRCLNTSTAPQLCDTTNGQYSFPGDSRCSVCPSGVSCQTKNNTVVFKTCAVGWYRLLGSTDCKMCPPGAFCPTGLNSPIPCPGGHYSFGGQTICKPCPAGYACFNGTSPIACPVGYYSLTFQMECRICPPGYYCRTTQSPPQLCSPGTYATSYATNCSACPKGYECPKTTEFMPSARRCLPGTFSTGRQYECTVCPAGYYCPRTDRDMIVPCAPGYFTVRGQTNCTICPAGYECRNSNREQMTPIACIGGTYSVGGQAACTVCPAGSSCPYVNRAVVIPCKNGTYSTPQSTSCTLCSAGNYCPRTAVTEYMPDFGPVGVGRQVPCSPGEYAMAGQFRCNKCPRGMVCSNPAAADGGAVACSKGEYTAIGTVFMYRGATTCVQCMNGYECPTPGEPPRPCPVGTYTARGNIACISCPAGFSCPTPTAMPQPCPAGMWSGNYSTMCKPCYAGYLCPAESGSPTPRNYECPMGSYCPSGSLAPIQCPGGTYGNTTKGQSIFQACTDCPPGYYCPQGTAGIRNVIKCPAGFYCPIASAVPSPCPAGSYSSIIGAMTLSVCLTCPEGFYCPAGTPIHAQRPCPPGYYCPPGTGSQTDNPCPAGTFDNQGSLVSLSQCQQCPMGSSCPLTGLVSPTPCPSGSYQPTTGAISCLLCEEGYACPKPGQTTSYTVPCDAGHFCPRGTVNPDQFSCPPGSYTFRNNLIRVEDCEICWRGFACPKGTGKSPYPQPIPCAQGYYCPGVPSPGNGKTYLYGTYAGDRAGSATDFPCPPGTYSSSTDLWSAEQCFDCPQGKYCTGGQAAPSGDCSSGFYCPAKSFLAQQVPCKAGTFNPSTARSMQAQCLDCQPGYFCLAGSSTQTKCPSGTYTPYNNTESAGPSVDITAKQCILCPAGYYCPPGSASPVECGVGKFSDRGQGSCTTCVAGSYCYTTTTTKDHMSRLFQCPAGLFCSNGTKAIPSADRNTCPAGFYCPIATTKPLACPPGTFSPSKGRSSMTECQLCPPGFYCSDSGLRNYTGECDPGYYCPAGSTGPRQVPCPARYYRSQTRGESEEFCAVCPRGYYCPQGTASPLSCTRGYYCVAGADKPEPCPIGTFGNSTRLRSQDDCSPCTAGYYCDGLGLAHPTGLCDPGYYCIGRAYTSAPPGLPTGGLCPKGGYCPAGSSFPTACAEGTFNNFTGGSTQADCIACTPGYYCSGSNLPYPTGPCSAGYYCTGGSRLPTQFRTPAGHFTLPGAAAPEECPLGTFNPSPGQGTCRPCISGYYCPNRAMISYYPCPTGSYCPAGSILPEACPIGTFNAYTRRQNLTDCTPCTAGMYCDSMNATGPAGPCREGFYCRKSCVTSTCSRYTIGDRIIDNRPSNPGLLSDYGGQCIYGAYCGNKTALPTPCPAGTIRDQLQGIERDRDCVACPAGYYCANTGMSTLLASNAPSKCTKGYYCPGGCSTTTCSNHAGEPCSTEWVGCTVGTSNNALASAGPRLCPTGFYCAEGSTFPTKCGLLPSGKSTFSSSRGLSECPLCPPRFYCDPNDLSSLQTPKACPAGRYCPRGTTSNQPKCPPGSWSNKQFLENMTQCALCTPGRYCPNYGHALIGDVSTPFCFGGFFCLSGARTGFGDVGILGGRGGPCPSGYYCPNATRGNVTYPCPPGTYKSKKLGASLSSCESCPPGFYCKGFGQSQPTGPCTPGFYCPRGCSDSLCSNKACDAGLSCAAFKGGPCPKGHYCPTSFVAGVSTGSAAPTMCPEGTYSKDLMSANCLKCPRGFFCGIGEITPQRCPTGHYCPYATKASSIPRCPAGTYNPRLMMMNVTNCLLCPKGQFCGEIGLNKTSGKCQAGYYCTLGARTPQGLLGIMGGSAGPCPAGFYCPTATPTNTSYPCPVGTYNPTKYQSNVTACLDCLPGYYCRGVGLTDVTGPCANGYYCPTQCKDDRCSNKPCKGNCAHPSPYEKPPYAAGGICPRSHYCVQTRVSGAVGVRSIIGAAAPVACSQGFYARDQGQSFCKVCPKGKWCPDVEYQPRACPPGYYCPQGTRFPQQFPCPEGTYNPNWNATNVTDCALCSAGRYCDRKGLNRTTGLCFEGYYCVQGARYGTGVIGLRGGSGGSCPPGYYCPPGTKSNTSFPCPRGTYQPLKRTNNRTACIPCQPGFYCSHPGQFTTSGKCAAGYYCPVGCSDAQCSNMPCRYNQADPRSFYQNGGVCPKGHYCPQLASRGTITPIQCPAGYYAPDVGSTSCLICPAGFYCGPATSIPGPCPKGHYCPYGSRPIPPACPEGTYNPKYFGTNISSCSLCLPGYYCSARGNQTVTGKCFAGYYCGGGNVNGRGKVGIRGGSGGDCPPGYYCPAGTVHAYQNACPPGTYQPRSRSTNSTYCLPCRPGFYCTGYASTNVTDRCDPGYYCPTRCSNGQCTNKACSGLCTFGQGGPCPLGHYCPSILNIAPVQSKIGLLRSSGAIIPTPCPEGTYSPGMARAVCLTCPQGHYCPVGTTASPYPVKCPQGKYCPRGTGSTQSLCPEGSYSDRFYLNTSSQCSKCRPGMFCYTQGLVTPTGLCESGYFCPGGAKDAYGRVGPLGGTVSPFKLDASNRQICPAGNYCPKGSSYPIQCPSGTYRGEQAGQNRTSCRKCDGGSYCLKTGLFAPSGKCAAGHFCPSGCVDNRCFSSTCAGLRGGLCPAGFYCRNGTTNPTPCPDGTYNPVKGQTRCITCPPGYFCHNASYTITPCPQGRYCPRGTGVNQPRCPPGSYSNRTSLWNITDCTLCDPTKVCSVAGLTKPNQWCEQGYYCQLGAMTVKGNVGKLGGDGGPCPRGHYCPVRTAKPIACPQGTYNPNYLGVNLTKACRLCDGGKYCAGFGQITITGSCSAGYFCTIGKSTATPPEGSCPAGNYCPLSSSKPTMCSAGTYNPLTLQTSSAACVTCDAGKYCLAGSATWSGPCQAGYYCPSGTQIATPAATTCAAGQFCPTGSATPRSCSPGMYCATPLLPAPTGGCSAGWYCKGGSQYARPNDNTGRPCPAGTYCGKNTSQPVPCPVGTYNSRAYQTSILACMPCWAGKYCPDVGQTIPRVNCSAGYYCPPGQSADKPVRYLCPIGYSCPEGTPGPIPCNNGFHSDTEGLATCKICPAGFYCDRRNMCPQTNYTAPKRCPAGYYCPPQTARANQFPCPSGTYSNITGLTAPSQCRPCPPGLYCPTKAMVKPGSMCSAGYYCSGGSNSTRPADNIGMGGSCKRGYYCPDGSAVMTPCPAGTFNPNDRGLSLKSCYPCTPGMYCAQSAQYTVTGPCNAGYYCPPGQAVASPSQFICPYGQYCPAGSAFWQPCPSGTYQSSSGQSSCVTCPAGKYCDASEPCRTCATLTPGTACRGNFTCPRQCPRGYYCLSGTKYESQYPCPVGRYGGGVNLQSLSDCTLCPPGQYCPTPGASSLSQLLCDAGYYCSSGSSTAQPTNGVNGDICPKGNYCPQGTSSPQKCPVGTYNPNTGGMKLENCQPCTPGRACTQIGLTAPDAYCAPGYFCKLGASVTKPNDGICPQGYVCPGATAKPKVCPNGEWTYTVGQFNCSDCMEGYYCNQINRCPKQNYTSPTPCNVGYYCPNRTRFPDEFPCPVGTFTTKRGLTKASECSPCPPGKSCPNTGHAYSYVDCTPGYYCIGGAKVPNPTDGVTGNVCPIGYYCPSGTAAPLPCPSKTYSDATGLTTVSQCKTCTGGKYCDGTGKTAPTGNCSAGYYCPGGQDSKTPVGFECLAGMFCPEGSSYPVPCPDGTWLPPSATGRLVCDACPAGFWCNYIQQQEPRFNKGNKMIVPVMCLPGFYCPSGTNKYNQYPCPAGTYSNTTGLQSDSQCTQCTPGRYCINKGQTKETGICSPGYYCLYGSSTPTPRTVSGSGGPCPPGKYCPKATGDSQGIPCPPGRYNDASGAANSTACRLCAPGYFCSSFGNSAMTGNGPCGAGYYCPMGSKSANDGTTICPAGTYCVGGNIAPVPCKGGTYNPTPGQSSCQFCPKYNYCPLRAVNPIPCPYKYACPANSSYPTLCPAGTYAPSNYPTISLGNTSECVLCPSGSYCTNGTISGKCAAGYWCQYGNKQPDPSDTDDVEKVKKGGLCPIGHYCPEGTTTKMACRNQTIGYTRGLQKETDCRPCLPGYYCIEESIIPIECPKGNYCPGYVGKGLGLLSCPAGTYNPNTLGTDISYCLPCLAGYYCPREGMTSSRLYPTPPGYYSFSGQQQPYPCPGGTYQPFGNGTAANSTSCRSCPEGFYCGPEASRYNFTCPEGTYCPRRSYQPLHCPTGHYCPARVAAPIPCPEGYTCSLLTPTPKLCWNGTYCPPLNSIPFLCPDGYISRNDSVLRINMDVSCQMCEPGSWSRNTLFCETCEAGYICLRGATSPTPTNETTQRGYICPPGYYCLAGSTEPTACPTGTYNNQTGGKSLEACIPCPENNYNPLLAQTTCQRCGKSSTSSSGATECTCIGKYRKFQKDDGSCRCIPGYIFYSEGQKLSEDDSELPCQPKVFERCANTDVRSSTGQCVSSSDSSTCSACPDNKGKVNAQLGVCECDTVQATDAVCDEKCRSQQSKIYIDSSTNEVVYTDPKTGEEERTKLEDTGAQGKLTCQSATNSKCQLASVKMTTSGTVGVYDPSTPAFTTSSSKKSGSRRRILQTSNTSQVISNTEKALANPLVCLNSGDGMMFDVSDSSRQHYPVYQKDNLLNTNPNFDYTAFRLLADSMKAANLTVNVFVFTFSDPGMYVFADNANPSSLTLVRVVQPQERCPSATFQPVTSNTLVALGIKREDNILLSPDWVLIGVLLIGIVVLVAGTIGGLWHFRRQMWGTVGSAVPRYRTLGMQAIKENAFAAYASKGTTMKRLMLSADGKELPTDESMPIVVKLSTPLAEFNQEEFVQKVYEIADVGPHAVEVISVVEGSTIITFRFINTPKAHETAQRFKLACPAHFPALESVEIPDGPDFHDPAMVAADLARVEDDFWDYERQIDLEGFNVRTLYDKLEDQTIHVVSQLANQKDDVIMLYEKILTETDAMKDMFVKIKLDIEDRLAKEKATIEKKQELMEQGKTELELPSDLKEVLTVFLDNFMKTHNWPTHPEGWQPGYGSGEGGYDQRVGVAPAFVPVDPHHGPGGIEASDEGLLMSDPTMENVEVFEDFLEVTGPTVTTGDTPKKPAPVGPSNDHYTASDGMEGKPRRKKSKSHLTGLVPKADQTDVARVQSMLQMKLMRSRKGLIAAEAPEELLEDPQKLQEWIDSEYVKRFPEQKVPTAPEDFEIWSKTTSKEIKTLKAALSSLSIPPEMQLHEDETPEEVATRRQHIQQALYDAHVALIRDELGLTEEDPLPADVEKEHQRIMNERDGSLFMRVRRAVRATQEMDVPEGLSDHSDLDEPTRQSRADRRAELGVGSVDIRRRASRIEAMEPLAPEEEPGDAPQDDERHKPHQPSAMAEAKALELAQQHAGTETELPFHAGESAVVPPPPDRTEAALFGLGRNALIAQMASEGAVPLELSEELDAGCSESERKDRVNQRKAFLRGARAALDNCDIPEELRDDDALTEGDRKARHELRAAFLAGRRGIESSTEDIRELLDAADATDPTGQKRDHLMAAFTQGQAARQQAENMIPEALRITEDMSDSKKEKAKHRLEAYQQGVRAKLDALQAEQELAEDPMDTEEEIRRKTQLREAFIQGKKAEEAISHIPEELRDDEKLSPDERNARTKARQAYMDGIHAKKILLEPEAPIEGLPEENTAEDQKGKQGKGEKTMRGAQQGRQGQGADSGVQEESEPASPEPPAKPPAPQPALPEVQLSPDQQKEVDAMKREHLLAMKEIKRKQHMEKETVLKELEEEVEEVKTKVEQQVVDIFERQRNQIEDEFNKRAALAQSEIAKKQLEEEKVKELDELAQQQKEVVQQKIAGAVHRMMQKKDARMKALEKRHTDEMRLEKTVQVEEEKDRIRRLQEEAQVAEDGASAIRNEDYVKQKEALAQKLKKKDAILRRKEQKEKEILEQELRETEKINNEMLQQQAADLEALERQRIQEMLKKNAAAGQLDEETKKRILEEEMGKINQLVAQQRKQEEEDLRAKLKEERLRKEQELAERQGKERNDHYATMQKEVDMILAKSQEAYVEALAKGNADKTVQDEAHRKKVEERLARKKQGGLAAAGQPGEETPQDGSQPLTAQQQRVLLKAEMQKQLLESQQGALADLAVVPVAIPVPPSTVATVKVELLEQDKVEAENAARENQRLLDEMKRRQERENKELEAALEKELKEEQERAQDRLRKVHEATMKQIKQSTMAQLDSETMSEDAQKKLWEEHDIRVKEQESKLKDEENRQRREAELRLQEKKNRRKKELEDKHVKEVTEVKTEGDKQIAEIQTAGQRKAEAEVIRKAIDSGAVKTEEDKKRMAQSVMYERHQRERSEMYARHRSMLDEAAEKLVSATKIPMEVAREQAKAELIEKFADERSELHVRQMQEVDEASGVPTTMDEFKFSIESQRRRMEDEGAKELARIKAELEEQRAKEEDRIKKQRAEFERQQKQLEEDERKRQEEADKRFKEEVERKRKEQENRRKQQIDELKQQNLSEEEQAEKTKAIMEKARLDEENRFKVESAERAKQEEQHRKKMEAKLKRQQQATAGPAQPTPAPAQQPPASTPGQGPQLVPPQPAGSTDQRRSQQWNNGAGGPAGAPMPMGTVQVWVDTMLDQMRNEILAPVMHRLDDIYNSVGKLHPPVALLSHYVDPREIAPTSEGTLVAVQASSLPTAQRVTLTFGVAVRDAIYREIADLPTPPIEIRIASSLPLSKCETTCFRTSFFFDRSSTPMTLYIRNTRLNSMGEFSLILVHCLAHITAERDRKALLISGDQTAWNDAEPNFLMYFHAMLEVCFELLTTKEGGARSESHKPRQRQDLLRVRDVPMNAALLRTLEAELGTLTDEVQKDKIIKEKFKWL